MTVSDWIVARTKPAREKWAAENIARQGFQYYLPITQEVRVSAGRRIAVARPLFPDYIFVKSDARWRAILSTFGIMHVLLSGDRPAMLPQREVDRLRSLEREGLVILPEPKFKNGQMVTVRNGPFFNQQGVYQGLGAKDRAKVLLDFLGRKTTVLIAEEMLSAV